MNETIEQQAQAREIRRLQGDVMLRAATDLSRVAFELMELQERIRTRSGPLTVPDGLLDVVEVRRLCANGLEVISNEWKEKP